MDPPRGPPLPEVARGGGAAARLPGSPVPPLLSARRSRAEGLGLPAAKPPVPAEPAPLMGLGPRRLRRPYLGFALLLAAPAPLRGQRRMSGLPR